ELVVYKLGDHREAAPGVWIPWQTSQAIYGPARTPGDQRRPLVGEVVATAVRVEANRVPLGRFVLHPPPGTLIKEMDSPELTPLRGGRDFLDAVVELAARRAAGYQRAGMAPRPPSAAPSWLDAVAALAIVVLLAMDARILVVEFIRPTI